ncbi:MAG: carboxypeptidase-like regulatory domain-containing protein [Bacteroidota bacterium]
MKKPLLLFILFIVSTSFVFGQGTIRGKIIDTNGETLIGVTVMLKNNRTVGTSSDFDGNYSLTFKDAGPQVVVFTYVSYKTQEITVNPEGKVIVKDILMESSAQELKGVEITAKATKAREYFSEMVKKNAAVSMDYISSETMKKTGDANVVAAVSRVSGVSTNGGFITVRGIGDRYVKTAVNGSMIPTLDPFTNNIKLDLFPASLIDNVFITKTASPDLPGDWAGAFLSVETKDYPENLSINVESSFGYNNQSTFKNIVSSERSSTDWLGYDDGMRNYDHNNFAFANTEPTLLQTFGALGLGDYYNTLGVTSIDPTEDISNTYFKLGLVQLGLLAPALFNDATAFAQAKDMFDTGGYKSNAFNTINANVAASAKRFANNWNTTNRFAPLNFSQSFSIGNQVNLFGKPLGFIAGFKYGSSVLYDPQSEVVRWTYDAIDGQKRTENISQQASRETNGWSALLNVAYKLNPNNSISLLFMPNITGVNNVRNSFDASEVPDIRITKSQFFEQRSQLVYQYKSEHYIPKFKLKIEANASYTNGNSEIPDFKNIRYISNPNGSYQIEGTSGAIARFYRYLNDDFFDSRISFELPITKDTTGLSRKLKFGSAFQRNDKKYDQYQYDVRTENSQFYGDLNSFLNYSNFDIQTQNGVSSFPAYYNSSEYSNAGAVNHTFGNSTIFAAYAMSDFAINKKLRLSGGVRAEKAKLFTDVTLFDSLGYAPNDERRYYDENFPLANPGKLDEWSILPSVNAIYKLKEMEGAPTNIRLNYSSSVARPSIRELSDIAVFDYEYRLPVVGNSSLKMVHINNYDVRYEKYYPSGNDFSASMFFKTFKNHIELVNSNFITWQNVDYSTVVGAEFEGRRKLTKKFEARTNITFVKSATEVVQNTIYVNNGQKVFVPIDTVKRSMFGQAPYIFNAIFSYNEDSLGLNVSLTYNVQGPRLVLSAGQKNVPDIYELPRNTIDLKVSKKLGKHFTVSLTGRDLLNAPIQRAYNYSDGSYQSGLGHSINTLFDSPIFKKEWNQSYDKFRFGSSFQVGVSYKI